MSGEPANFSLRDAAYWESRRKPQRERPGPRATLGQLQRGSSPWCWLCCEKCQHRTAIALAPFVIRWGPNESSDKLRHSARCTVCGTKGATLQHPSWMGEQVGFQPWPMPKADQSGRRVRSGRQAFLVAGAGEFFATGVGNLIGTKRVSLLFVPCGLIDRAMDSIRNMKSSANIVSLLCSTFISSCGESRRFDAGEDRSAESRKMCPRSQKR